MTREGVEKEGGHEWTLPQTWAHRPVRREDDHGLGGSRRHWLGRDVNLVEPTCIGLGDLLGLTESHHSHAEVCTQGVLVLRGGSERVCHLPKVPGSME